MPASDSLPSPPSGASRPAAAAASAAAVTPAAGVGVAPAIGPAPAAADPLTAPRAALMSAVPDLALGLVFLLTWVMPRALEPRLARSLLVVMVMEFIVIHSAAFMGLAVFAPGSRRSRALAIARFGGFYSLFAGGFALAFGSIWPLLNYWGLTLNRLLSVLFGQAPDGEEQLFIRKGWAATTLCYLGGAFLTTWFPLPRLGMTPDVVSSLELPSSGLWISQPWRPLAFGFIYFTAVGISELYGHRWIRARDLPPLQS